MTPKRKKKITFVVIAIFFFLGGVEYAVILPTVYLFLEQKFHAETYTLGFVFSAFSLSGLLAGPVMGKISDKSRNTKAVLLVSNLFEIAGSIMYFLSFNVWFLICSRFVAGIGTGVGSALFADITRVTPTEQRTAVMSVFLAIRQIGLLLGPGCNLFLRHINFTIADTVDVNKFTVPGAFMAILWTLHEVLVLFLYWNLPQLQLEEDLDTQGAYSSQYSTFTGGHGDNASLNSPCLEPPCPPHSVTSTPRTSRRRLQDSPVSHTSEPLATPKPTTQDEIDTGCLTSSNEMIETVERFMSCTPPKHRPIFGFLGDFKEDHFSEEPFPSLNPLPPAAGDLFPNGSINRTPPNSFTDYGTVPHLTAITTALTPTDDNMDTDVPVITNKTFGALVKRHMGDYMREEVVTILGTVFVAFFNQMALESMLTPLTLKLFHWGELQNSLVFCAASAQIVLVLLLIRWLSRYVHDRVLLAVGFLIETLTVAFFLWFIPQCKPNDLRNNLPGLAIGIFLDLLAIPLLSVASTSLYSKITCSRNQGFAQGVRRVFVGLGTILGPLWATSLVKHKLYVMLGVMLALNVICASMLVFSFHHLKEPSPPSSPPGSPRRNGQRARGQGQTQQGEIQPLLS